MADLDLHDSLSAAGHSPEQVDALVELHGCLLGLGTAFQGVRAAGLSPADALRACGIDIPAFATPMVNQMMP